MVKVKAVGCQACPLSECKEQNFVAPSIPENPDLIVLFSTHDKEGNENPDISDVLNYVTLLLGKKKPVILASQQCRGEYSLKSLKACREAYILPTLENYQKLPVLVLGEKAAHHVLGYKAAMIGKNGMAGKVITLGMANQPHYFTYGDIAHKGHIKVMTESIIGEMPEVEFKFGMPFDDFWETKSITLDIEHTDCNPYLGGKIDCIGIANEESDVVYCILANEFDILVDRLNGFSGILAGHNISSDLVWLGKIGLGVNRELKIWDTMIHRKTRPDAPERGFGLKCILKQDYKIQGYEAVVHGYWHREEIPSLSDLAWYNAVDVIGTKHIMLDQKSDDRNASTFFLAMDYITPMVNLMGNGIYVSPEKMKELDDGTAEKIEKIKLEIQEIVGMKVEVKDGEDLHEV